MKDKLLIRYVIESINNNSATLAALMETVKTHVPEATDKLNKIEKDWFEAHDNITGVYSEILALTDKENKNA